MCAKCDKVNKQESEDLSQFHWNGKIPAVPSRRRRTESRLAHWHKLRRARHYGVRSRHTGYDRTRQTLGDSLAVMACAACLSVARISMSPGGDIFFFMKHDAFSQCHPLTNFVFFVGAIGFAVVIQHPVYLAASCAGGALYYLLLNGKKGMGLILGMLPVFALLSGLNPLFNTYGERVLFYIFGKPYTLEALYYGMAIGGIFVAMLLWFGCYSAVLTSDKFVCLFGSLIPALSLLLVMVLRMIPSLTRKAKQLMDARKCIGKGAGETSSLKEKASDGMNVLSALTDWALEGSIVTADSMRARGYGAARRTSFQLYRMTLRDWTLLALMLLLIALVVFAGGTEAAYTPVLHIAAPTWGFGAYCLYLLLPPVLHGKEAIQWRISRSKI